MAFEGNLPRLGFISHTMKKKIYKVIWRCYYLLDYDSGVLL